MTKLFFFLFMSFSVVAFAAGETYEIVFSYYDNLGVKMRRESLFEVSKEGGRVEIQKRVYLDSKNELREASFFNADRRKWELYPGDKLPTHRRAELQEANNLVKKRVLDKPAEEREGADSLIRPASSKVKPENPNAILCEKAGNEFVICEGIPFRKERSGAVNATGREIKVPSERRPAIIGPFQEDSSTIPAP